MCGGERCGGRCDLSAAGVAAALVVEEGGAVQDTNVTRVQEVLVGVYGQRVHGPPP